MRRTPLSFGMIILFVGLVVFSISNQFTETFESVRVEESNAEDLPYGEWKTSAHFERGERFWLRFSGPKLEGVPNGGVELVINITGPESGNTTLKVNFRMKTAGPELNVTVKSKSESLEVDDSDFGDFSDSPEDFGGLALLDGNYSASIDAYSPYVAGYYYPPNATLPYMEFWKRVPIRTYPHSQLLPVGGILIIAGLLLSVWAVKSPRQTRRSKRK